MELLRPRQTYHRANSDDLSAPNDTFEMMSTYSEPASKHDSVQEYSFDYHLQGNTDQVPRIEASTYARWFSGWRTGAYTAAGLASCSLVINIVAVVWLSRHPNSDSNLVEVFSGSCNTVANMERWVHLAINAPSTLLLAGSNYCMQCLCAPNRGEIDKAHSRGRFLDIGVPSLRNFSSIASYKVVMWWLLGLSSIPLHLMHVKTWVQRVRLISIGTILPFTPLWRPTTTTSTWLPRTSCQALIHLMLMRTQISIPNITSQLRGFSGKSPATTRSSSAISMLSRVSMHMVRFLCKNTAIW
jgi:hypothetical protein